MMASLVFGMGLEFMKVVPAAMGGTNHRVDEKKTKLPEK
ncbi:MAG: hypothetical protein HW387_1058 [Parachlamydiales bacterium]|nr:hypothetical protein [Parachlamydiales bacterium]